MQRDELIKAIEAGVKHKSWDETLKKNDWMNVWLAGDGKYKKFLDGRQASAKYWPLSLGKKGMP